MIENNVKYRKQETCLCLPDSEITLRKKLEYMSSYRCKFG